MAAKLDERYEVVIGLEVHAELMTRTKIFCSCPTDFGAPPNTQCCPICMGLPGTLPVLNRRVVDLALVAGLATDCQITRVSRQDRKNYFYPDLPKAYQISQYDLPLCVGGQLPVILPGAGEKRVGITRIHIEEDAGKLIHSPDATLIDYNRCGVPLIEIVSEPDLRSAAEAVGYVKKLRSILMYASVTDGRMNQGSLRCDVNLSVREWGDSELGTRTEIKNLNSFQSIARAIESEAARQIDLVSSGGAVVQETRRFDVESGETYAMRAKEDAHDYRYFPDPDLALIEVTEYMLDRAAASIPDLPDARVARYTRDHALSAYDADQLVADRDIADYFEACLAAGGRAKPVANIIISDIFRLLPPGETIINLPPAHLAAVANMADSGEINSSTARKLVERLFTSGGDPREIVKSESLAQIGDHDLLRPLVTETLNANPRLVADYLGGKLSVINALVGKVMALSSGRADPVAVRGLVEEGLGGRQGLRPCTPPKGPVP